jgi:hypothetical protein
MSTLYVDTIAEKTAGNGVQIPGHVVQVVNNALAVQQTYSSTSPVNGNLSASITPKYSNSKLLVMMTINGIHNANAFSGTNLYLYRDGSAASLGSSGRWAYATGYDSAGGNIVSAALNFLDNANSTSSTTFAVYASLYGTAPAYINVNPGDTSSITLMEIAQ